VTTSLSKEDIWCVPQ